MFANGDRIYLIRRLVRAGMALFAAFGALALAAQPASAKRSAYVLEINGAIGPATSSYITKGLAKARKDGAELVIITMDTPGGLDTSMREIIQQILAMPVPVVTYVHPSGARAASAGTYILYASHIAAMTPGTNLGAATPIQIGAVPSPGEGGKDDKGQAAPGNASERKAVNDAVAYIRSLAELRGRNAEWGEKAVLDAASLSANAALKDGVIDIVAPDMRSLLAQLDGRVVTIKGTAHTLHTAGIALTRIKPDWRTNFLAAITNPNIALILMMVGFYGLILEFFNPGSMVPGTIGAISLLVGLYALSALPVDLAGLALIALGIGLMIAEAHAPSFGVLGLGGLASFLFGATILFDTDVPEFQANWSIIAALGVFGAGLIILVGRVGIKSLRSRVHTGTEEMIGARGTVIDWNEGAGHVFVHSERWNAAGPSSLDSGAPVTVVSVNGLQLEVSSADEAAN